MPSSLISNNSMLTSQDIGMSQYEMESSGVFSDADAGRKSAQQFESRTEYDLNPFPAVLPELVEVLESVVEQTVGINDQTVDANVVDPEDDDDGFLADVANDGLEHGVDAEDLEEDAADDKENEADFSTEISSLAEGPTRQNRSHKPVVEPVKRPRSQEAKGLATRRSELLQDKPILPNTNVGSKLKEILSRQPAFSERHGKVKLWLVIGFQ